MKSDTRITRIDSFLEKDDKDDDYEIIELFCGRCGHEWKGSEMYEGACPNCGTVISRPGTGTASGKTCGNCKNHRHYPKCCEVHGQDGPDGITPSWGISAVNCPDYEPAEGSA